MYNAGGGELVARGAFFTFFAGKKVTKNLVTKKTRFCIGSLVLFLCLLSRLFAFQSYLFSALWPKKGRPVCSNSFSSHVLPSRNDLNMHIVETRVARLYRKICWAEVYFRSRVENHKILIVRNHLCGFWPEKKIINAITIARGLYHHTLSLCSQCCKR